MSNVLKFETRLVRSLSGVSGVPLPDELQPFHLASPNERRRRIRRTLVGGLVVWRKGGVSLVDAVRSYASSDATAEYALREMRHVLCELNLPAWEAHPNRVRADVRALFKKAIRRVDVHRGGWRVHHTRTHSVG